MWDIFPRRLRNGTANHRVGQSARRDDHHRRHRPRAGHIAQTFKFQGNDDVHHVSATRLGYASQTVELTKGYDQPDLLIQLEPQKKTLTFHVAPVAGIISVDGKPVGDAPLTETTVVLPLRWTKRINGRSTPYRHRGRGYHDAQQVVRWDDQSADYTLNLDTMRKDLSVTTTPPGAQVSINGQALGSSPVTAKGFAFPADPRTGKYLPQRLAVSKPGI